MRTIGSGELRCLTLEDVERFLGDVPQNDDINLIVAKDGTPSDDAVETPLTETTPHLANV